MHRFHFTLAVCLLAPVCGFADPLPDGRYLYVACPGIRNYLEFGGAGVLVFDMDHGHKFVKRIDTPHSKADKPDNVKGVCASADVWADYQKVFAPEADTATSPPAFGRRPEAVTLRPVLVGSLQDASE